MARSLKVRPNHPHWLHARPKADTWNGQAGFNVLQQKADGYRVTAFKQKDGSIKIYGRDDRPDLEFTSRFPRLEKEPWFLRLLDLPALSSVDGELLVPNGKATDVPTALRDASKPLRFGAFAVPYLRGNDTGGETLDWARKQCEKLGIGFLEFNYQERDDLPKDLAAARKQLLDAATRWKCEGWVLKGTRHYLDRWFKLKHVRTADCIVTGWEPGEGKYKGMLGSLTVSVFKREAAKEVPWDHRINKPLLVEVAHCSGMTDAERESMTRLATRKKGANLLGLVCEVEYQQVESKGRLRHPRFVRWRDDKPWYQCTMAQLEQNE